MQKSKYLFILILFSTIAVKGQGHNNLYFELLGNAGIYSINYERDIIDSFSGRVGYMFLPTGEESLTAAPIILNYSHRLTDNSFLQFGAGFTFITGKLNFGSLGKKGTNNSLPTGVLGYCYKSNYGFLFRISFTPLYHNKEIVPLGGISFGVNF